MRLNTPAELLAYWIFLSQPRTIDADQHPKTIAQLSLCFDEAELCGVPGCLLPTDPVELVRFYGTRWIKMPKSIDRPRAHRNRRLRHLRGDRKPPR